MRRLYSKFHETGRLMIITEIPGRYELMASLCDRTVTPMPSGHGLAAVLQPTNGDANAEKAADRFRRERNPARPGDGDAGLRADLRREDRDATVVRQSHHVFRGVDP